MATLKISDLSVGDWVRYDDRICQIAEIYQLSYTFGRKEMSIAPSVTLYYEDDMPTYQESVPFKDIHPIPITAEILKKNGWECVEVGDKGPATPKQNYNRFERWRLETKWGKRDLFFDRATKVYRLNGMNDCKFAEVHKLQHALRLSDIYNYEINL